MNRLLMLLVTGALAFALTACGDKGNSKPNDDKGTTAVEEVKAKMDDAAHDADDAMKKGADAVDNTVQDTKDAVTGDDANKTNTNQEQQPTDKTE